MTLWWFQVINSNEHSLKDNLIKDFYHDWSIEEICDTVILESSHPLKPSKSKNDALMFYTYECENNELAYFKVDVNLIDRLPDAYLGIVW